MNRSLELILKKWFAVEGITPKKIIFYPEKTIWIQIEIFMWSPEWFNYSLSFECSLTEFLFSPNMNTCKIIAKINIENKYKFLEISKTELFDEERIIKQKLVHENDKERMNLIGYYLFRR